MEAGQAHYLSSPQGGSLGQPWPWPGPAGALGAGPPVGALAAPGQAGREAQCSGPVEVGEPQDQEAQV